MPIIDIVPSLDAQARVGELLMLLEIDTIELILPSVFFNKNLHPFARISQTKNKWIIKNKIKQNMIYCR